MTPHSISSEPEYAVLLDAVVPAAGHEADFAAWHPGRWGELLNAADWHRLSPALFTHLSAVGGAPAPVLSALERAYLANVARSMFVRAAASSVVDALSGAGIESMLLKGAALIETVYRDPAEREMLDIDVLVAPERMNEATAAVRALGFLPRVDTDAADGSRRTPAASTLQHHEPALVSPDNLLAVELHRHIVTSDEGHHFSLAGFWERARVVPATGHTVPSPEDLLIHVCFHFTRNRLGGTAQRRNTGGALAQILDIQRLVSAGEIDWDLVTRTAREFHLGTRVYLGLFAAQQLGVRIPAEAIEPIRPHGFDERLGRQLVTLRVLRAGDHLPVRSMRWMLAPSREALRRGWNADPNATLSLARAYMRRAQAHLPEARSTLRRPWVYLQDLKLNGQIESLRERA